MSRTDSISIAIVEAIAAVEGVDSLHLDFSLENYVDTAALDVLGNRADIDWTLQMTVAHHVVTVDTQVGVTVDGETFAWTGQRGIPAESRRHRSRERAADH